MKRTVLFFGFIVLILPHSFSQLYQGKYLKLKRHYSQSDTTSEEYLKKYSDITNLHVTILDTYEHEDLQIFQLAPRTKGLSIQSDSIKSLSGLENLSQLETLSIFRNKIFDFNALAKIGSLKQLHIDSKILIDFPLDLKFLERLTYTCNYDLSNCDFPSLKQLSIHQVPSLDIDRDDDNYGVDYKLEKPCCPIDLSSFDSLTTITIYNLSLIHI